MLPKKAQEFICENLLGIILYMERFYTPRVVLNKLWFYAFLENSEIRNSSRLPGDSSALPREL